MSGWWPSDAGATPIPELKATERPNNCGPTLGVVKDTKCGMEMDSLNTGQKDSTTFAQTRQNDSKKYFW
jgi:hypothetical protein